MRQQIRFAPANPCVFLADASGGNAPDPKSVRAIESTPSCIRISCMSDVEDGTMFTLGDVSDVGMVEAASFDGAIAVTNHLIVLSTAEGTRILETPWPHDSVRVRIWTNRDQWPDEVTIGLAAVTA